MPEVVKRIGPMRLVFTVGANDDGTRYAWLQEIGWDGSDKALRHWTARQTDNGWERQKLSEIGFFIDIDDMFSDEVAASDAAREAIERERLDLQREDAERLAER